MYFLYILSFVLLFVICISILINYLSLTIKKNAFQIVKEMGIGWSLSNSFNCYNPNIKIMTNPDEQLKLYGNELPTKKLITSIKKYGFKTIRVPITWIYFIDESGTINPAWMDRIKEVVNWIIKLNLYCIINIDKDGGEWLSQGMNSKNKFIHLWTQIANEFKNYNEYLIFQSMEQVEYKIGNDYDYITLLNINQAFVDTVRNTGGKNSDRLLIVAGMNQDPELTCLSLYKIPIDPSRKLAISFYYYIPANFAIESTDNPWTWVDADGVSHIIPSVNNWGSESDFKELFVYFENFKEMFIDKGYPIIISETGVLTEDKKDINQAREFLYSVFSMTRAFDGMMACLMDTSDKKYGIMNYYDRVKDKWYDEVVKDIFKKLTQGEFLKFTDFSYYSNKDTVTNVNYSGSLTLKIGKKKVKKVIFNVKLAIDYNSVNFGVFTNDKRGIYFSLTVNGNDGKKNFDGSYTYTIDVSKKDFNDYVEVQKWWNSEYITFRYLSVIFDKEYTFFDYTAYKNNL